MQATTDGFFMLILGFNLGIGVLGIAIYIMAGLLEKENFKNKN